MPDAQVVIDQFCANLGQFCARWRRLFGRQILRVYRDDDESLTGETLSQIDEPQIILYWQVPARAGESPPFRSTLSGQLVSQFIDAGRVQPVQDYNQRQRCETRGDVGGILDQGGNADWYAEARSSKIRGATG